MKEQIEVSAKYKITLETDKMNRPCAYLILNTPKAKYAKEKTIRAHFFANEDARYKWTVKMAAQILKEERETAARKSANKVAAKNICVEVGSIFSHSWGYDQTNIQYYEVVKMTGQTVTIRELCQNKEDTGLAQGKCTPIPGKYYGKEEMVKRVQVSGSAIYLSMECGFCKLWDGTPDNWTAYA